MRTFARQDGPDWVLSGTKMWITNGSVADIAVVWARTSEGIRWFLVPRGVAGFTARYPQEALAARVDHLRTALRRGPPACRRRTARRLRAQGPAGVPDGNSV